MATRLRISRRHRVISCLERRNVIAGIVFLVRSARQTGRSGFQNTRQDFNHTLWFSFSGCATLESDTVSNTAFRGFGGSQGMLAIERVIDAIAWDRGLDPLDVRKANLYGAGRDVTPYGQTVEDYDVAPRLIRSSSSVRRITAHGARRLRNSTRARRF